MLTVKRHYRLCIVAAALLSLSACNTLKQNDSLESQRLNDPFEGFNRGVYGFNSAADKAVLKPVAKAYHAVVPDAAERSVGRFFRNLGEPLNIVNNLLQGKIDGALNSTYRFAVNSTVGVLGLFDVAKAYDVEHRPEDFGQTFAAWGANPGPYIVIPFLGPTNFRDGFGRIVSRAAFNPNKKITNSSGAELSLFVLDVIDVRAGLLGIDETLNNQLDPYLFLKDAYESNRINAIYDGTPPVPVDDGFDF
jgi:phospholipid-binding lipoprotein MlaA